MIRIIGEKSSINQCYSKLALCRYSSRLRRSQRFLGCGCSFGSRRLPKLQPHPKNLCERRRREEFLMSHFWGFSVSNMKSYVVLKANMQQQEGHKELDSLDDTLYE